MRDMIGDFLANGHPDRVGMGCASAAHGRFYAEHFPCRAGTTYSFQAVNEDEDEWTVAVNFARDTRRRRRHAFDPSAFVIGVPRVPAEFKDIKPMSGPSV